MSEKKSKTRKKNSNSEVIKQKGLFDHLDAIRTSKDPKYYDNLNESEQKGFSHWAILNGLSMDVNLIELVAFLWRDGYYDKIPSKQFYQLLVDIVPQTNQRLYWVKKSKSKNTELLKVVSSWYSCSQRESEEYIDMFLLNDNGFNQLANILEGSGLTDREAEKLLKSE